MNLQTIKVRAATIDELSPLAGTSNPDISRGTIRLGMLRGQYPEGKLEYFPDYVSTLGLEDESELTQVLGVRYDDLSDIPIDDRCGKWTETLLKILNEVGSDQKKQDELSEDLVDQFLVPFNSYIRGKLIEILNNASNCNQWQVSSAFRSSFVQPPQEVMRMLITQTVILESNIVMLGESTYTTGKTMDRWLETMLHREFYESFFEEYSFLGRQLVRICEETVASRREFLERLKEDTGFLITISRAEKKLKLEKVSFGAGDPHSNGRSVTIIETGNATGIVYKPRPMDVDRVYGDCTRLVLNALGLTAPVPWTLARKNYGWQQYIAHTPCSDASQFDEFYHELGVILAISYVFGLSDLHCENIIADGPHPVIVDAETVFAPAVQYRGNEAENKGDEQISIEGNQSFSVLDTSILPSNQGKDGPLFWGAADSDGIWSAVQVPILPAVDRLDAAIEYDRVRLPTFKNVPFTGSLKADWREYEESLIRGFTEAYKYIEDKTDDLLKIVRELAPESRYRAVLRGTSLYGSVLQVANHPDYMRDGVEVERLYSVVWRYPTRPDSRVVMSELSQLRRLDIPYFASEFCRAEVIDVEGNVVWNLSSTAEKWLEMHLCNLGDHDLERQLWYIHASYITGGTTSEGGANETRVSCPLAVPAAEPSSHFDACLDDDLEGDLYNMAKFLLERILHGVTRIGSASWNSVSPMSIDGDKWSVGPVGFDLYQGSSGIGLSLLYLADQFNNEQGLDVVEALATRASYYLKRVISTVDNGGPSDNSVADLSDIGLFGAVGGGMYFLSHHGYILGRNQEHVEVIGATIDAILKRGIREARVDIISGAGGLIEALRSVWDVFPELRDVVEDLIRLCVDSIVETQAVLTENESGWIQPDQDPNALVGYSHGASGIALALGRGANLVGEMDDRIWNCIARAMRFERSAYKDRLSWPDLRLEAVSSDQGRGMVAWCHGAPGVALARAEMIGSGLYAGSMEDELLSDLRSSIAESIKAMRGDSQVSIAGCLCHGGLGNILILDHIENCVQGMVDDGLLEEFISCFLRSVERDGLLCGVPRGIEVPGLMTGVSGASLALLSLAKGHGSKKGRNIPMVLAAGTPSGNS